MLNIMNVNIPVPHVLSTNYSALNQKRPPQREGGDYFEGWLGPQPSSLPSESPHGFPLSALPKRWAQTSREASKMIFSATLMVGGFSLLQTGAQHGNAARRLCSHTMIVVSLVCVSQNEAADVDAVAGWGTPGMEERGRGGGL